MNKKQIVAIWVTITLICCFFLFYPKQYVIYHNGTKMIVSAGHNSYTIPEINWKELLPLSIIILVSGVVITFLLKDKRKE